MMRCRPFASLVLSLISLLALLSLPAPGHADGGYLPAKSFATPPRLPRQRALIAFNGTTETLVVESTLQADAGTRFAWLLPLPAAPSKLKPTDAGMLNTLEMCYGPKIINATQQPVGWIMLCSITTLLLLIAVYSESSRRSAVSLVQLIWILAFFSLMAVGGPTPHSSSHAGAQVLKRERVGNYDVAVLKARQTAEIDDWLREQQYAPLPSAARQTVAAYLKEGWVIMAARLERNDKGFLTPHPLYVEFPARQPVYPMRLTAMAGSIVDLTLFVIAPQRYDCPELQTIYASLDHKVSMDYRSDDDVVKNHQELAALCNENDWLTRLHGSLSPDQMKKDFMLSPAISQSNYIATFYTPDAQLFSAWAPCSPLLMVLLPSIAWLSKRKWWLGVCLYFIAGGLTLGYLGWHSSKTPVISDFKTVDRYSNSRSSMELEIRDKLIHLQVPPQATTEQVQTALRQAIIGKCHNYMTDEPIAEEQSPGNCQIINDAQGNFKMVLYNEHCQAISFYEYTNGVGQGLI